MLDEDQRPLPFTIKDGALQFFSGAPGAVSVVTGDRETVYSLTLPDVAEAAWRVPANVRRGVPRVTELESPPQDFWPWLARARRPGIAAGLAAVRPQPPLPPAAWTRHSCTYANSPKEGLMTFDRIWVLYIAWLPLAWAAWEWGRTRRRLALSLKALSLLAILLALAEPRLKVNETRVAVAVLVDTSDSISPTDLTRASQLAQSMQSAQGRHWMRVVPFARGTRALESNEQSQLKLRQTAGEAGRATDMESGVREAIASLPAGLVPRVVLISDGKENKGSIARAAWQAQQLGIPIDTYALAGRPKPTLRLDSISLPSVAFTGEQFPIDLAVSAPQAGPAQIELSAEGHSIGKTNVQLQAGDNPVRMHTSLNTPGALDLSIAIRSDANASTPASEVRFEQAVTVRRPKILYISSDDPAQDSHLPQTLKAAQFDLERISELPTAKLSDYQIVVFNDWDLETIPPAFMDETESFVKQGGGLLVIAGEHSLFKEGKTKETALDRALPATLAPPRSPEGTAVIIIIDKSSSMEGKKIELARLAASGVGGESAPYRHRGRADVRQQFRVGGHAAPRR